MTDLEKIAQQITDKIKTLGESSCIICGETTKEYGIAFDQAQIFGKPTAEKQRITFYPICEEHKHCEEEVIERLKTRAQAMRN